MSKYNNIKSRILFGKYKLNKILGRGAFGCVFHGININDNSEVAIKLEDKKGENLLEKESNFLYILKGYGIPEIKSYGHSGKFNVLVEELLGNNLLQVKFIKKKFTLKEISLLAIQIIDRLEYIHSKYIIHRDLKPENFLFGYKNSSTLYLIDFGISKKYRSSRTGKHVRFSKTNKFCGTIRYSSFNSCRGMEQSRRDDLESLGYMLIFLCNVKLPWQGLYLKNHKFQDIKENYIKMLKLKKNISPHDLCGNLPFEFEEYIKYSKNLEFEQDPDYEYLRNLFRKILMNKIEINDNKLSLSKYINKLSKNVNNDIIISKDNYINLLYRKESIHKRLYRTIQKSLEKDKNIKKKKIGKKIDLSYDTKNKLYNNKMTLNINNRGLSEDAIKKNINKNNSNISKDNWSYNSHFAYYNLNILELQEKNILFDKFNSKNKNTKKGFKSISPDYKRNLNIKIFNEKNFDLKSCDCCINKNLEKKDFNILLNNNLEKENMKIIRKRFNISLDLDKKYLKDSTLSNHRSLSEKIKNNNINLKTKLTKNEKDRKLYCRNIYINIINKINNQMEKINKNYIKRKKENKLDNSKNVNKINRNKNQNINLKQEFNENSFSFKNINLNKEKKNIEVDKNIYIENNINNQNNNKVFVNNIANNNKLNKINEKKRIKINTQNRNNNIKNYLDNQIFENKNRKVNIIINNKVNEIERFSPDKIIDINNIPNNQYNINSIINTDFNKIKKREIYNNLYSNNIGSNDIVHKNYNRSYDYIHKNPKNNYINGKIQNIKLMQNKYSCDNNNEINPNKNISLKNNNNIHMIFPQKEINKNNIINTSNIRKTKILEYKSLYNNEENSYIKGINDNNNKKYKYLLNTNSNDGSSIENVSTLLSRKINDFKNYNNNIMIKVPSNLYSDNLNINTNNNTQLYTENNKFNSNINYSPNFRVSKETNIYNLKQQYAKRKILNKIDNKQRNILKFGKKYFKLYSPINIGNKEILEYKSNNRSSDVMRITNIHNTSNSIKKKNLNYNLENIKDKKRINHIPKNINSLYC